MPEKLERRIFLKSSILAGIASFFHPGFIAAKSNGIKPGIFYDIAVVHGYDYYQNTIKALELIGGVKKVVNKGDKVGIIVNSPWTKQGTYTNPDVALAVIKQCFDAGAIQVTMLKNPAKEYWEKAVTIQEHEKIIARLSKSRGKILAKIPRSKLLKQVEVARELIECDTLINIPIAKDHQGTRFTGTLKNLMGVCPYSSNKRFHLPDGTTGGFYDNIEHLSRCIAELNLLRKPDLCVVDVTEVIIKNGPAGPGDIIFPRKVIAGFDPVAVDAKAAMLLGLEPDNILMINYAEELGIGTKYLSKYEIIETSANK